MYNYIPIPVKTENTFQWSSGFLNDSYKMSNNKLIRNLNCFLKSDLQKLTTNKILICVPHWNFYFEFTIY